MKTRIVIPKYRRQKAKPVDRAFVELNRRRHYLGMYGSPESRENYNRLIAEWLDRDRQPHVATPQVDLTVAEVLLAFTEHAHRYYRRDDGTLTNEITAFRSALRIVRALYGRSLAVEFGPTSLATVRPEMIRLGWARTHINKQISRIRSVFKWAASQE